MPIKTNDLTKAISQARKHIQKVTGYEIKQDDLVRQCLGPTVVQATSRQDVRRLAIMGDLALHVAIKHNWWRTGREVKILTGLMNRATTNNRLSFTARVVDLPAHLVCDTDERAADHMEAIFGAIYLDSGYDFKAIDTAVKTLKLDQDPLPGKPQVRKGENVPSTRSTVSESNETGDPDDLSVEQAESEDLLTVLPERVVEDSQAAPGLRSGPNESDELADQSVEQAKLEDSAVVLPEQIAEDPRTAQAIASELHTPGKHSAEQARQEDAVALPPRTAEDPRVTQARKHIEKVTGYDVKNGDLVRQCMGITPHASVYRLAKMGDMALKNAIHENWWHTGQPTGVAANLEMFMASNARLSQTARIAELPQHLCIANTEGKRLADHLEAVLGAVWVDSGRDLKTITAAVEKLRLHFPLDPDELKKASLEGEPSDIIEKEDVADQAAQEGSVTPGDITATKAEQTKAQEQSNQARRTPSATKSDTPVKPSRSKTRSHKERDLSALKAILDKELKTPKADKPDDGNDAILGHGVPVSTDASEDDDVTPNPDAVRKSPGGALVRKWAGDIPYYVEGDLPPNASGSANETTTPVIRRINFDSTPTSPVRRIIRKRARARRDTLVDVIQSGFKVDHVASTPATEDEEEEPDPDDEELGFHG